jgi:hypothetical protein
MSQDTGKTIVSKELEDIISQEEPNPALPDLQKLPWVTVKVKSVAEQEASISCCLMMIDLRTVTLSDFPFKSAVGLLRESRDGSIAAIQVVTEVGTFEFDAKSEVSVSSSGSDLSIVSLTPPRGE